MLYQWMGREEPLGSPVYTAQRLCIETFAEAEGTTKVSGQIYTMDYAENCASSHRWVAEGRRESDDIIWDVQHDPRGHFSWQDKAGRPMFTLAKVFDDAIEAFVKTQIGLYMSSAKDEHGVVESRPVKRYDGPKLAYTGPCVCQELLRANASAPFPWESMTGGGQFPKKCFTCSCGRNWWNYHPEHGLWGPVPDRSLYAMLTEHDGEPQRPVGSLEDGLYLVKTLRERGLIPLA